MLELMARACQTCVAYSALKRQCRADVPRPLPVGLTPSGEPIVLGTWPPVDPDDWCMKWAAAEQAQES